MQGGGGHGGLAGSRARSRAPARLYCQAAAPCGAAHSQAVCLQQRRQQSWAGAPAGGGVCQLSSTVYNALLLAGFGIVERHRHMQPVRYAEPGRDATIRYGKKDLRMQNLTGADCLIRVTLTDSTLAVSIRSSAPRAFDVEIIAEESETEIPLEEHVRPGIEVDVFRVKYRNGKLIEKGLLYRDFYPPVRVQ